MKTFVVRLWSPAGEVEAHAPTQPLRGTIEAVGTDRAAPFRDGSELVRLLETALEADDDKTGRRGGSR